MLDIIIIDAASAFPRRSFAYEWTNRVGVVLGLILNFGFSIMALIVTFRRWDGPRASAWIVRVIAILLPLVFALKLWGGILDAFWLR